MIGIDASDDRLPDAYDDLSNRLEGLGTLYIPHVVIRPEARMALIRAPRVVVGLLVPAAVEQVEDWAAAYLASSPTAELGFQRDGRRVVLRGDEGFTARGRLRDLVSDDATDH